MPDHDTIYFRISKNNRGIKPANTLAQLHQEYADLQNARSASRPVSKTLYNCVVAVSYIVTGVGDQAHPYGDK